VVAVILHLAQVLCLAVAAWLVISGAARKDPVRQVAGTFLAAFCSGFSAAVSLAGGSWAELLS
jgi:hypothetical protein